MALGDRDLLSGEAVQRSKGANLVIRTDEAGLVGFTFDHLLGSMAGMEAVGGRLHLTNYRLVFNSHPVNRLVGRISILLPTIQEVRDTSRGVKRRIEVVTGTQRFTFVVWGVPKLIEAVDGARSRLDDAQVRDLAAAAVAESAKLGTGMKISEGVDAVVASLGLTQPTAARIPAGPPPGRPDPIATASRLNLAELLADERCTRDS